MILSRVKTLTPGKKEKVISDTGKRGKEELIRNAEGKEQKTRV